MAVALLLSVTGCGSGYLSSDRKSPGKTTTTRSLPDYAGEANPLRTKTGFDEEGVKIGGDLFYAQCAGCHGPTGKGNGPFARGMKPPPTNLRKLLGARDDRLMNSITKGVGDNMPSFAEDLVEGERWSVLAYVCATFTPDKCLSPSRAP